MPVKRESEIDTEREWYDEAKKMLRGFGVENPTVGESGEIPVSPGTREVKRVDVTENTPLVKKVMNHDFRTPQAAVANVNPRVQQNYGDPICNNLSCNVISLLNRDCSYEATSWKDPVVDVAGLPNQVPDSTAYLNPFDASIEGTVEYEMRNDSTPGQKLTQTIFKCKENGPLNEDPRPDSGVMDEDFSNTLTETREGNNMHQVGNQVDGMEAGTTTTFTADFEVTGGVNVIESLFEAWTSGSFETQANGSLTVDYTWRGDNKSQEFDVTSTVSVPVSSITYSW